MIMRFLFALILLIMAIPRVIAGEANPASKSLSFAHKWALVIGVDKFRDTSWNLRYAAKDAADFGTYLVKDAGFASNHVRTLTGQDATFEHINDAISWLGGVSRPDDLAVIFIRTRGTYKDASGNNHLAASDTVAGQKSTQNAFEMKGFVDDFVKRVHAKGIVIIVDADFSSLVGEGMHLRSNLDDACPPGTNLLMIRSAGPSDLAWESTSYPNSVFTGTFLKRLRSAPDGSLLKNAYAINDEVAAEVNAIKPHRMQHVVTTGIGRAIPGTCDFSLCAR